MKRQTRNLAIVMVVFMLLQAIMWIPAFAANEPAIATDVTTAKSAVARINLIYTHEDNVDYLLQGESGFFIDQNYMLTCAHGLELTNEDVELLSDPLIFGDYFRNNYKNRLKVEVVFNRDVKVTATITEAKSSLYDFAVLKLNTPLNGVTVLALGSDEMVTDALQIHCLGFPAYIGHEERELYKPEDVTITTGNVGKNVNYEGTDLFMHGAKLTGGNSGGPTITADGKVIGISKATNSSEGDYGYSVYIDDVKDVLDKFGIPYKKADEAIGGNTGSNNGGSASTDTTAAVCQHNWGAPVMNNCIPTYTCSLCQETKQDPASHSYSDEWTVKTEAQVGVAGVESRKCNVCGEEETREIAALEKAPINWMLIIIIAAVVIVVVVVVVIIIVATSGKKQPAPAPAPAPAQRPVAPAAAPQAPVHAPVPPVPPVRPMDDGAGNTTVLNEGAGETTVLGGGAAASTCSLLRMKNGEKITIAAGEFVIGKEKRRVNYCISDNNSISRAHAKIITRGTSHYIVDMNSTNFTFVNGTKLASGQEHLLNNGDKIKLSDEEFEFKA